MELLLPISAITALIFFGLFLKERIQRIKQKPPPLPLTGREIDKNTEKSYQLLNETVKKSQDMLTTAEAESLKIVTDSKSKIQELESEHRKELYQYVKEFETSLKTTSAQVSQSIALASSQFNTFLNQLAEKSQQFEAANEQATTVRIEQVLDQLETKLSEFLLESEQKTTGSIELELQSVRQLIETYKQQQLKLIDENIVAMMEKTMALVIGKRLSLKDQLDLVYESLERAKLEKFII